MAVAVIHPIAQRRESLVVVEAARHPGRAVLRGGGASGIADPAERRELRRAPTLGGVDARLACLRFEACCLHLETWFEANVDLTTYFLDPDELLGELRAARWADAPRGSGQRPVGLRA